MSDCTFRRYRVLEEPSIALLMRALDAEGAGIRPISEATIARTLAHLRAEGDRAMCAVAEDSGGALVGYALLFPFWSSEYGGELLLLDELYVAPERRGQGIGARFLAWLEEHARSTGRVAISLTAMGHNKRAIAFYERIGYNRLDLVSFDKLISHSAEAPR